MDPITNLQSAGGAVLAQGMLTRLIDFFKSLQITLLLTSLTRFDSAPEGTDVGVSSLIDTWILLREMESDGERNRSIYILKSRGMRHPRRVRGFELTDQGIRLIPASPESGEIPAGPSRRARPARRKASRANGRRGPGPGVARRRGRL